MGIVTLCLQSKINKTYIMKRFKKQTSLKVRSNFSLFSTLILFMAFIIFSSCSSDDDSVLPNDTGIMQLPTLTIESGSSSLNQGVVGSPENGSLIYTIKANAPNGFDKLIIEKLIDGQADDYETIDINHPNYVAGSNSFTYSLNYILSEDDVDKNISFKAKVFDIENYAEELYFAEAETRMPMHFAYLPMRTDNPPSSAGNIPYFIYADHNELERRTISIMSNSNDDHHNIMAVLSWNDGSGLYLSAPNTTLETQLTQELIYKSATKFKEVNISGNEFYDYTIYDVYEMENLFNEASFNAHQEKADDLQIGKTFSFLTEDGNAGLIYIKDIEVSGNLIYADIDMFYAR